MVARTRNPTPAADRVLVIRRVFDAPRDLVFRCWTERQHVMQWLAPRDFTIPAAAGDARAGAAWSMTMRQPDGTDLRLAGVYREVTPPERLVFTHAWLDERGHPGHETVVTVTFAERGGKTEMTFQQAEFASRDERDGHQGGWGECFDRLGALLSTLSRQ